MSEERYKIERLGVWPEDLDKTKLMLQLDQPSTAQITAWCPVCAKPVHVETHEVGALTTFSPCGCALQDSRAVMWLE